METNMETTIIYWDYLGIMEKNTETTIVYRGVYRDNGQENGNYFNILGLCRDGAAVSQSASSCCYHGSHCLVFFLMVLVGFFLFCHH